MNLLNMEIKIKIIIRYNQCEILSFNVPRKAI